jgi:hypothetical protein
VLLKHESDVQRARGGLEGRSGRGGSQAMDRYDAYDSDPRRRKR